MTSSETQYRTMVVMAGKALARIVHDCCDDDARDAAKEALTSPVRAEVDRYAALERVAEAARAFKYGVAVSVDVDSDDDELVDEVVRQVLEQVGEVARPLVTAMWELDDDGS